MKQKTDEIMKYMLDTYGVEPEYPWISTPNTAVFRNARTKKWFALLLGGLPRRCLGLPDEGCADVLNLKCDPVMTFSIIDRQRVFRAYHMNKEHWISVLIDSPITQEEWMFLIDMSYRLVDAAGRRKA